MSYIYQQKKWVTASREDCVAKNGMVASKHPLVGEAGVDMMTKGGNAVDAAVASAFVDCVVEPHFNGIGGTGIMAIHLTETGENVIIDYVGRAPANCTPDVYELEPDRGRVGYFQWIAVKDDANFVGHKSVAVPGEVAGLCLALERYGTMNLEDVLEPAIKIAEKGFITTWQLSTDIYRNTEKFWRLPEWKKVFLKNGQFPPLPWTRAAHEAPRTFVQKDLANSLRKIAKDGPDVFYKGEIADAIAREMKMNDGILTKEDLAKYEPRIVKPSLGSYRNYSVVYDPIHAGTTLMEMLNILEGFDLPALGFCTAESIHIIAEAIGLAFSDRFKYMGDPDFIDVPQKGLVSKGYAKQLQKKIDFTKAIKLESGDPWLFEPNCTTALTVADKDRSIVAVNQTLVTEFGSGVVVPGTGIILNNAMWGFDPEPGHMNSIAPRKRRLQNVCPTLLLESGRSFLCLGAPGGRAIPVSLVHVIVNIIDYGMGIQEAIEAPKVTREVQEVYFDNRIPKSVSDKLERTGLKIIRIDREMYNFARPVGVLVDYENGMLHGGVHCSFTATGGHCFESQPVGY